MFTEEYKVRFYETDGLQHVGNTVLVGWFEAAREPIFRMFVPDLKFTDWPLILANYKVDFLQQIFLQSPVQIKTWISRIGDSSFDVYQECWQEEQLKVKGSTTMVHFDYVKQKSRTLPDHIRLQLTTHLLSQ